MTSDGAGGLKIARAHESFSTLTLAGSDLHAEPPLLGSREVLPGFTRELYQVRWRPNDYIDLYVILPRGVNNPPAVLYMYGFPTDTDRFKNNAWCQRVTASGAAAIGFVSALTGQRYTFRPFKENFITELPEALASTVHDIPMVLDYLATRHDIDMSRIGILGQGSGGAVAVLAASVEPRLKAVDLLDPWGDWPDWFAAAPEAKDYRALATDVAFQAKLAPLEPLHVLPTLHAPVRLQIVEDTGQPKAVTDAYAAAVPANAQLVRFKNSRRMYDQNSGGRLFEWMAGQLGAHPAPPAPAATTSSPSTSAAKP